jgi:hypothetical protein
LQRGDTPKNRFQVETSDVRLRDQFGHGNKMRRQRTGSTSSRGHCRSQAVAVLPPKTGNEIPAPDV